jgi:hypothetical protein
MGLASEANVRAPVVRTAGFPVSDRPGTGAGSVATARWRPPGRQNVILLGGFIWEAVMADEAREIILAEHKWFCRQIPWIFASGFMFGWLIKTLSDLH